VEIIFKNHLPRSRDGLSFPRPMRTGRSGGCGDKKFVCNRRARPLFLKFKILLVQKQKAPSGNAWGFAIFKML
jgi:hypothetical protein